MYQIPFSKTGQRVTKGVNNDDKKCFLKYIVTKANKFNHSIYIGTLF